jgi:hypothetical protein
MSSAAEAEIGAVFINAKKGALLRTTLKELGQKQPPTPMETDNTTAAGYSNGTIKERRKKAMDMRFYWIKYRVKQGQFNVYWGKGFQNLADYFTKHHSPAHHKKIRDIYIHANDRPINREGIRDSALLGCVNTSGQAGAQIPHNPPPWEMMHLPVGDNALCMQPYTVYTAVCNKSLTATHQYKISNPSNKVLVNNN